MTDFDTSNLGGNQPPGCICFVDRKKIGARRTGFWIHFQNIWNLGQKLSWPTKITGKTPIKCWNVPWYWTALRIWSESLKRAFFVFASCLYVCVHVCEQAIGHTLWPKNLFFNIISIWLYLHKVFFRFLIFFYHFRVFFGGYFSVFSVRG